MRKPASEIAAAIGLLVAATSSKSLDALFGSETTMDKQLSVVFSGVEWDHAAGPSIFCLPIRSVFLEDQDGLLPHDDLKDIMDAYLQDEFCKTPKSFSFYVVKV